MAVTPRDASTVVLMRDSHPGTGPPQVLLVRRHARATFAAGTYVFPGGALEAEDCGNQAQALSPGFSPRQALANIPDAESGEMALGLFVAAIRETFEEVGVLLARTPEGGRWHPGAAGDRLLDSAREEMYHGRLDFLAWVREQNLTLATQDLVYFAHWITPEIRPQRFDTRFFLTHVPVETDVRADRREVFDRLWLTPDEAIRRQQAGELNLMRPTTQNLALLAAYPSVPEAMEAHRGMHVPTILPKIVETGNGERVVLHPGDAGYDEA